MSSGAERYQLGDLLGRGGQGHTFRALDRDSGQPVAVKVMTLGNQDDWKPFDLFERECRTLKALSHPGIPRFLDTFAEEEQGKYYLVMELIEGSSLRESLEGGELLSDQRLWTLLYQSLEILAYLHERRPPVIHRDIKPANLMRKPDGALVLVDFGGVRVALREDGGSTMVGTLGYMAPEQLHGEATPATDIYSLGATLAALCSGTEADKLPRRGLKLNLDEAIPNPRLRTLLTRMVEPDPEQRLSSVEAVCRAARETSSVSARPPASTAMTVPEPQLPATASDSPLHGVKGPLGLVLRVLGMAGYVGLTVLDAVILPLFVAIFSAAWKDKPGKRSWLKQKQQRVRAGLRGGRKAMGALSRGKDPYRLKGPKPPRALPPHRRRRGGRR